MVKQDTNKIRRERQKAPVRARKHGGGGGKKKMGSTHTDTAICRNRSLPCRHANKNEAMISHSLVLDEDRGCAATVQCRTVQCADKDAKTRAK